MWAGEGYRIGGGYAALSPSEFRVLARLSGDGGNLVTQDDLLDALHGPEEYDSATIRPHMSRLRQKLEDLGADPGCIRTVRGEGYALEVDLL